MSERQGHGQGLSEHELSEIRMLIEERTGICFDESRERFFSTRVREHLRAKGMERSTELLRAMRKSNVEYEGQLERLLTQRSEEHTSELQSPCNLVCRLLLEKKKKDRTHGNGDAIS